MLSEQFRSFKRLALESEDESWHMSRRPLARGTTAFVSGTIRDAGMLGEAMRRIARGYNIVHGGSFNRVEQRPDRVVYRIDDAGFPFDPALSADAAQTMMETVLIFVHAMLSLVAGVNLNPHLRCVRVRRTVGVPADSPLDFWSAPIRPGSACYALEYASSVAALTVRPDFATFGTVEVWAQAIRMIEPHCRSAPDGLVDRVRAAIADGAHDQAQVARRLGVSVATMRRRLETCGCRFRDLRAEVLNDQARRLLGGRRDAADVAEALGFADGRSFARAFKSWNGVTPHDYQRHVAITH